MTDLPPGPGLDALVAERVMGWERLEGQELLDRLWPDNYPSQNKHQERVWVRRGTDEVMACKECGTIPSYSTEIAAAWEVVEAVKFYNMAIKWDADGAWLSGIPNPFWGVPVHEGRGDSVPHAICLAALAAVGSP